MPVPIFNQGSPEDKASISLSSRCGKHIPNERRREWPPDMLREAIAIRRKTNPFAELRSITATYNCMGQVFASRRTYIDVEEVRRVLAEDGYSRLNSLADVEVGDVVVYCKNGIPEHVGTIAYFTYTPLGHREVKVISKWGAEGEYIHSLRDVPLDLCGEPTEYWSDRKKLA